MHFNFYRGKVKLPSVGVCIILDVIFYIRLLLAFCRVGMTLTENLIEIEKE